MFAFSTYRALCSVCRSRGSFLRGERQSGSAQEGLFLADPLCDHPVQQHGKRTAVREGLSGYYVLECAYWQECRLQESEDTVQAPTAVTI